MRRARRATERKDWLGAVLIVAALAALGALAGAGFLLRPPPTDPETLCRADAPLAAHTIILVDATDRLEPRHRRRLQAVARQEGARLARYERLTVAAIRADRPQEPRLLFSLCNPGDGRTANPLYQNTRDAQARWDAAFGEALTRALRRAGGGRPAASSPILASVRALVADPDFGPDIQRRRLVLVSDLLEHTAGFSLYAPGASYAAWRAGAGARAPDFSGVSVRLVLLDRPERAAVQANALDAFWTPLIEASATDLQVDPSP